jgi:hypothetical protein
MVGLSGGRRETIDPADLLAFTNQLMQSNDSTLSQSLLAPPSFTDLSLHDNREQQEGDSSMVNTTTTSNNTLDLVAAIGRTLKSQDSSTITNESLLPLNEMMNHRYKSFDSPSITANTNTNMNTIPAASTVTEQSYVNASVIQTQHIDSDNSHKKSSKSKRRKSRSFAVEDETRRETIDPADLIALTEELMNRNDDNSNDDDNLYRNMADTSRLSIQDHRRETIDIHDMEWLKEQAMNDSNSTNMSFSAMMEARGVETSSFLAEGNNKDVDEESMDDNATVNTMDLVGSVEHALQENSFDNESLTNESLLPLNEVLNRHYHYQREEKEESVLVTTPKSSRHSRRSSKNSSKSSKSEKQRKMNDSTNSKKSTRSTISVLRKSKSVEEDQHREEEFEAHNTSPHLQVSSLMESTMNISALSK